MPSSRLRQLLAVWNWDVAIHIAKTSFAVALAWSLCSPFFHEFPVFGSIAALLVVQGTVYQTFRAALSRSVGVVAGVLLSLFLGRWLGVQAFSVGLMVASGLVVGRLLNLGNQSLQVAVTALLLLAVSGLKRDFAAARILETILGGGVGVAIHMLVRPPVHVDAARHNLRRSAHNLGVALHRIGTSLRKSPLNAHEALELLQCARQQTGLIRGVSESLDSAEESLRFNFQHRATFIGVVDDLQEQLNTLERLGVQTRSMARTLYDMSLSDLSWEPDVRLAVADCVLGCALASRRFGDFVDGQDGARPRLADALIQLRSKVERASEVLAVDAAAQPTHWDTDGYIQTVFRRFLSELTLATESKHP